MASVAGSAAKIMCIEDLPKYRKLVSQDYVPFNLEIVSPAQNQFYSDEDAGANGPALFSTRGTRCEKRSAPTEADSATAKSDIPASELPHAIKIIAGRFRKDFALDCKAIHENSWKHLSYYFDDLDIYHWKSELLQQVLQHLSQENATLHTRVLRFAVHLLATDTPRARNAAYFGRANWFYEEIAHYGSDFLEETLKFMTHRTDVIEKLTPCATKYLEEAKGDLHMAPMWYDKAFRKLAEARIARFCRSNRPPIVVKQQTSAPLAPALDSGVGESQLSDAIIAEPTLRAPNKETDAPLPSSATSKKSSQHHRRTSSFDGSGLIQASSIRSVAPVVSARKRDTRDVSQTKSVIRVAIPKIPVPDNRKKSAGEHSILTTGGTSVLKAEATPTTVAPLSSVSISAHDDKKEVSQEAAETEKVGSQTVTDGTTKKAVVTKIAKELSSKEVVKPKIEDKPATAEDVQKASPFPTNITGSIVIQKSGNQNPFPREGNTQAPSQKKPDSKKFNGKRIITDGQRWPSGSQRKFSTGSSDNTRSGMQNSGTTTGKSGKGKKKSGHNKRRGSGMQDEARNASLSAEFSNARTRHSNKPSTSRSIFDDDDSIVSVTMNGKRQDSPNRSSEAVRKGQASLDPRANFRTASSGDGFQEITASGQRTISQSSGPMPLYGPSPFPEFNHQPWPRVQMPPLNPAAAPYMAMSNGEVPPAPNQYIQWAPVHPQALMHPVQHYGPGAEPPFMSVVQHNAVPSYHQQFDPTAGVFQPQHQVLQPYQHQHQSQYGRREQYRRYPDDVRYANDRPSYRRWNFPRGRRGSSTRFFSSGTVESRNDFTERMSPTNGDTSQHATSENPGGMTTHEALTSEGDQSRRTHEEAGNVSRKEVHTDSPSTEPQSSSITSVQVDGHTVEKTLEASTDVVSAPIMQYPMVYPRVQPAAFESGDVETPAESVAQEPSANKDVNVASKQHRLKADDNVRADGAPLKIDAKEKPVLSNYARVSSQQMLSVFDENKSRTVPITSNTENQPPVIIKNELAEISVAQQNVLKPPKNKSQDIRTKLGGSSAQGQTQPSEPKSAKPRQGAQHQSKGFTWAQKTKSLTMDTSVSPGENRFPKLGVPEPKQETQKVIALTVAPARPAEPANSVLKVSRPTVVPSQSTEPANPIPSLGNSTGINGPWPRHFNHDYDRIDHCKLYISGLGLTDESLAKISESYRPRHIGPVRDCRRHGFPHKPLLPVGTRYGFVTFASSDACRTAKHGLMGQTREGIILTVRPAFLRGMWENATNESQVHASPMAEEFPPLTASGNASPANGDVPFRSQADNKKSHKEQQKASSAHVNKVKQPLQDHSNSRTLKPSNDSLPSSVQVSPATIPDRLATTSSEDATQDSVRPKVVEPLTLPVPIVSDHPPIQGRLKKTKNKQKNKAKQQRKVTGNHDDRRMTDTPSPDHSRGTSIDQDQSFSKVSKDEADTEQIDAHKSIPSSSNSNVYALGIKVSDQPYDMSGGVEEDVRIETRRRACTGRTFRLSHGKDELTQPPNSPVDVVMTDILDAEILQGNGLGISIQDSQSTNSFNNSVQEDIVRSEETFGQLTAPDHHSHGNSGMTVSGTPLDREKQVEKITELYSAPSLDTEQHSPESSGRSLIVVIPRSQVPSIGSGANGNRSLEAPVAGPSPPKQPTNKTPQGQNDSTKGWDKSVKLNTKNVRNGGRHKTMKGRSAQEGKTSIEMIHTGDTNGAPNQDVNKETDSHPSEQVNNHKSA